MTLSVCALLPYPEGTVPGQRYRIEQWRPYLNDQGISVDLFPFADARLTELLKQPGHVISKSTQMAAAFAKRLTDLARTRQYDAVLIYRAACLAGPAILERAIRLFRKPVIYDFDDAIFLLHTAAVNRRFGWLKCPAKTASICRLSSEVVVGNSFLAGYARQYNPRVTVIPSGVDTIRYQPLEKQSAGRRVRVGWTGSSTSQTHLEMFAPLLRALISRRDVEIHVISDREPLLPGVPVVWRRWSAETETDDLHLLDIGIMPMPDDAWSRGKCSMKALQCMALGIPTVCSSVGTNREVIEHGRSGFLAATPEEWLTFLETLIDNPLLRARMGAEARKTVEDRYSMRRCAKLFAGVVRDAVEPLPLNESRPQEVLWKCRSNTP